MEIDRLARDREHCTVFVADLPDGITEDELNALFKDVSPVALKTTRSTLIAFLQCGKVREVKITQLSGAIVATVEFFERVHLLDTARHAVSDWLCRTVSLRP
jgi:RNA recognition motif-containing protein